MTQYGDEQGGAGQQPRHAQYERQAWGNSEQPRLGHQYGGEPSYTQPPPGQHSQGKEHYAQPPGPQQPGPPQQQGQPTYQHSYQQQPYEGAPPWGQQQAPGYVRVPQGDPNSPYSASAYQGYRLDPATKRDLGVPGLIVTIIGAVLLILAFTALDWYHNVSGDSFGNGSSGGTFSDLHHTVSGLKTQLDANPAVKGDYSFGVSVIYFSWLGWVMLAAAVLAALISVLPTAATPVMRGVSFVLGLAGAGLTVWAADLFSVSGPLRDVVQNQYDFSPTFSFWLKHSYLGGWFAVGGFLIVAFGGLLGSHLRHRSS